MPFVAGQTVGSYQILGQLGQGGMATVYKAYHAALDRYVAIKVLHQAFLEDPTFLARFQREARVVARLDHPNIIPIYDFAQQDGLPYLVMKYIEGETLKARLERGPLSQDEMLQVVDAVGSALQYAHAQGILHRDIKPSNVLLTQEGGIYLADFGLARIAQSSEMSLTSDRMVGTPQYISPEQALSKADLDARTDIYSFGVMLYEIAVGRVPFNADTPFAVIHDHIYSPLPPPRQVNPKVALPVERVLLKALAKDPQDRFENAASMVRAVHVAVQGLPVPEAVIPTVVAQPVPEQSPQPTQVPPAASSTVSGVAGEFIGALGQVLGHAMQGASAELKDELSKATVELRVEAEKMAAAQQEPAVASVPAVKKNRRFAWGWLVPGVVLLLLMAFMAVRVAGLRQSAREHWQVTATAIQSAIPATLLPVVQLQPTRTAVMENSPQAPSSNLGHAEQEMKLAINAYLGGDVGEAKRHLGVMMNAAGEDVEFYDMALKTMMEQGAWGLALWMTIEPPQAAPLDFLRDRSEQMHQLVYLAAADPLAEVVFEQQQGVPFFAVASTRREMLFGDMASAKRRLGELMQDRMVRERFPEVNLLEAELYLKLDDPQAQNVLDRILKDAAMPAWIVDMARQLNKP